MATRLSGRLTAAFLALLGPAPAVAQQAQPRLLWDWPGPWHMWGGWGTWWWIFPLVMLLMIAGCIAMMLLVHRSGGTGRHHAEPAAGDPTLSALQILDQRFARGEIRREEYEERKRAILTMTAPTGNV